MESEGRNPASHLKNALEYIQNPDKTEECVLGGGINCLPDTTFEQMEETKNIFNRTGKRQGGTKLVGLSGEYQSWLVIIMSGILLRLIYSDLILPM